VRSAINFLPGAVIDLGAGNGSDITGGESRGGNAGVLNISVLDLMNTTYFNISGLGGYSSVSGIAGGNGGIVQLTFKGLIRNFTLSTYTPKLNAGSSANSGAGTAGRIIYNKILTNPLSNKRDADVDGDGQVQVHDITSIRDLYNNYSTDNTFDENADINIDNRISVTDIARVGFEFFTR